MGELSLFKNVSYNTTTCITCGVDIVLVNEFYTHRKKDGKNYYCPNGHSQHFIVGETEEQRLRKVIEKEREWRARQERETERQRELKNAALNRERAQKGVVTRMKKRTALGACQHCNRSFQNLRKHMEIKHPEHV